MVKVNNFYKYVKFLKNIMEFKENHQKREEWWQWNEE